MTPGELFEVKVLEHVPTVEHVERGLTAQVIANRLGVSVSFVLVYLRALCAGGFIRFHVDKRHCMRWSRA